ncbi:MAG: hypothetical protein KGP35_10320 [Bacteroidetes bacterium]|nr:hypothetical protein [Bacteroidota bacterium]
MKKMNSSIRFTVIALIAGSLWLTACKKEKINLTDQAGTIESIEDNTVSDVNFDTQLDQALDLAADYNPDLFSTEPQGSPNGRLANPVNARLQGCANITVDTTITTFFPVTVTIDFGTGCAGPGNRLRKGKIITEYSGKMRQPGSVAKTRFENFYVDSMSVEGNVTVTNQSTIGKPQLRRQLANGKLSWPSGRWITRSFDRTFTFLAGFQTRPRIDDRISITGTGRGENRRGKTWSNEITDALIFSGKCEYGEVTKGVISFRHNTALGTINFGSDAEVCDGKAMLTVNGTTKEINLR